MISIKDLSKYYQVGERSVQVLKEVTLQVDTGELVAIVGQSGAGKSTLLNIIGMLDTYDEGSYHLQGKQIKHLTEAETTRYRNQLIGFVFQRFHLIAGKTALYNVALPLYYQGVGKRERLDRAEAILARMGLKDHLLHTPNKLSGGQQQRVAIARALVTNPPLILADEPTGALDSATSQEIMALIQEMHQSGKTVLIITHSTEVSQQCERTIMIKDGSIA